MFRCRLFSTFSYSVIFSAVTFSFLCDSSLFHFIIFCVMLSHFLRCISTFSLFSCISLLLPIIDISPSRGGDYFVIGHFEEILISFHFAELRKISLSITEPVTLIFSSKTKYENIDYHAGHYADAFRWVRCGFHFFLRLFVDAEPFHFFFSRVFRSFDIIVIIVDYRSHHFHVCRLYFHYEMTFSGSRCAAGRNISFIDYLYLYFFVTLMTFHWL